TRVGKSPSSPHNVAIKCCEDLKNQSRHIDTIIDKQTVQEIVNNRLRLKTSVDAIRLAFQACSFRGHDEHHDSQNQGNFLELLKMLASYNEKSKREQMSLVLRFVNKEGFVLERFFDLVHVKDTFASTLNNIIN
ncbi:LOW QUALITY PROTEIN: DUF4371 domain-containing protein, partial [Cephalotus follicularis]